MTIASIVTRGRGFGGVPLLVTHGFGLTGPVTQVVTRQTTGGADYWLPSHERRKRRKEDSVRAAIEAAERKLLGLEDKAEEAEKEVSEVAPDNGEALRARQYKEQILAEIGRVERQIEALRQKYRKIQQEIEDDEEVSLLLSAIM